jgi:transcriptional regulator with XRE-family HTH domain
LSVRDCELCGRRRNSRRETSRNARAFLRCYISRVENGHTIPAVETLEKLARAMEIPLYQIFYDGEGPPKIPNLLKRETEGNDAAWGSSGNNARQLGQFRKGS